MLHRETPNRSLSSLSFCFSFFPILILSAKVRSRTVEVTYSVVRLKLYWFDLLWVYCSINPQLMEPMEFEP